MSTGRRVLLFIATSLDGYIARGDGNIDWLKAAQTPGEDYGYGAFIQTVDTVILGRKTYEMVLSFGIGFPHQNKKCYVLTRHPRPADQYVEFYSGDVGALIAGLRKNAGGDIFVDGGAEVIHEFMTRRLIDRMTISVLPILLGGGIPLFRSGFPETAVVLRESRAYPSGLVQSVYDRAPGHGEKG